MAKEVVITAPHFETLELTVEGTAPLVVNKFSAKAREQMKLKQEAGSKKAKSAKDPKNFKQCWQDARHISEEGWDGIAAASMRKAIVTACKLVGFPMTKARIGIFIEADGIDREEGTPLLRVIGDEPEYVEHPVRNDTGVPDIRPRPMWRKWALNLRVRYDADMFDDEQIAALVMRAGAQCGICEGRPSSESGGMGWGLFKIAE